VLAAGRGPDDTPEAMYTLSGSNSAVCRSSHCRQRIACVNHCSLVSLDNAPPALPLCQCDSPLSGAERYRAHMHVAV